jgi:hypothetical protein
VVVLPEFFFLGFLSLSRLSLFLFSAALRLSLLLRLDRLNGALAKKVITLLAEQEREKRKKENFCCFLRLVIFCCVKKCTIHAQIIQSRFFFHWYLTRMCLSAAR